VGPLATELQHFPALRKSTAVFSFQSKTRVVSTLQPPWSQQQMRARTATTFPERSWNYDSEPWRDHSGGGHASEICSPTTKTPRRSPWSDAVAVSAEWRSAASPGGGRRL